MVKKADVFIISFIVACCILIAFFCFFQKNGENLRYVNIYVDGKKEYSYVLNGNTDENVKINSKYGYNEIIIKNGEVFVKEADCGGKDCVKAGAVKENGEFIVCAPHRLLVKIGEENEEDVQAVSY